MCQHAFGHFLIVTRDHSHKFTKTFVLFFLVHIKYHKTLPLCYSTYGFYALCAILQLSPENRKMKRYVEGWKSNQHKKSILFLEFSIPDILI